MINKFFTLRRFLSKDLNITFYVAILLSLLMSIVEVVGVSIVVPFLALANNNEPVTEWYYLEIMKFFSLESKNDFMILLGTFIVLLFVFRGMYTIYFNYFINNYIFKIYSYLSELLFKKYLYLNYLYFTRLNITEVTKIITRDPYNIGLLFENILRMFSELIIFILLLGLMFYIDVTITITFMIVVALKIFFIIKPINKGIKKQGYLRNKAEENFYKIVNSAFGNFKVIKLFGNSNTILSMYNNSFRQYSGANVVSTTLNSIPRNIIENTAFISLVLSVIYVIIYNGEKLSSILPTLGLFVMALYRLLPSVNKIIGNYTSIIFYLKSYELVIDSLNFDEDHAGNYSIEFKKSIKTKNIFFEYIDGKIILENINLSINKGDKIGIVGESGSGKSTLIDILSGLLISNRGNLLVDDIEITEKNVGSWRKKIAYIQQFTYLFDGTVAENITFGSVYDEKKVLNALRRANIYDDIMAKDGLGTKVGDNGVQLSGGQKQRIALARAFYLDKEIFILDEVTAALDQENEEKVMDEIYNSLQEKTLIIIAHKISTLYGCNKIIRIQKGKLYE